MRGAPAAAGGRCGRSGLALAAAPVLRGCGWSSADTAALRSHGEKMHPTGYPQTQSFGYLLHPGKFCPISRPENRCENSWSLFFLLKMSARILARIFGSQKCLQEFLERFFISQKVCKNSWSDFRKAKKGPRILGRILDIPPSPSAIANRFGERCLRRKSAPPAFSSPRRDSARPAGRTVQKKDTGVLEMVLHSATGSRFARNSSGVRIGISLAE